MKIINSKKMINDVIVRSMQNEDAEQVVHLLEYVFNGWPNFCLGSENNSYNYWRWKYLENPNKAHLSVVAEHEEKIVGCLHGMPQKVKIGDNWYDVLCGTDLVVHPEYRRQGIYNQMYSLRCELEDNQFFLRYGISNNPIVLEKDVKLGFSTLPCKEIIYTKIKDINIYKKHHENTPLHKQLGYHIIKKYHNIKNKKPLNKEDNLTVKKVYKFDDNINDFIKKISVRYNFMVERNKETLNWRYLHPLHLGYNVLSVEQEGEILGYSVFCIDHSKPSYPLGHIVDLLVDINTLEAFYALLDEVEKYFIENGVNQVNWQISEKSLYSKLANQYGFLNSRYENRLDYQVIHPRTKDIDILENSGPSSIHFTYGDFDWI